MIVSIEFRAVALLASMASEAFPLCYSGSLGVQLSTSYPEKSCLESNLSLVNSFKHLGQPNLA